MSLLRRVIGGVLRRVRLRQGRTLREVAQAAGVSLPYLSEVERGRKEASSEVLAAICRALGIHLSDLLEEARDELRRVERRTPVTSGVALARLDRVPAAHGSRTGPHLRVGGGPRLHARRPALPAPLLGGSLRLPETAFPLNGAGLGHPAPMNVGSGTRIWLIPTPAEARRRPRTSATLARRRVRSGRRRLTAA
ncbi:helix-turn-helix transcriptional regulator [Micromonospora sp. DR5-3]|uniref:helix-turn-helix domain-containing protein n=1 Tax=unclassified Micromonospora TaxID=2617518 RepID=UPI0011D90A90|nr:MULTISPECIES: helix-turn-helix transcriptional regulator [unclassified Micromonospora]MCW3816219.1 helix-turn-helix transcriptional regulator [Micromonospora sp. DR5-3]TYC23993.1 helix-turn-helix transcriptional regulator [Micromonospora sp. MP36]